MFRSKKEGKNYGFTLIELLVVIAIIGILASVVLASLNSARKKSRDARRLADVKQLQVALELYYDANTSKYPATLALVEGATSCGTGPCIAKMPKDPLGATTYSYTSFPAACTDYHLGASLEESTNPALTGDVDDITLETTLCTGSVADFSGVDTAKCATTDNGVACYDVKP